MSSSKSSEARRAAQELAYDAMEAVDDKTAVALCRRALAIYPDCVDAILQIGEVEAVYVRDLIEVGRRAVEAGRRDLGPRYFKQNRGTFWLDLETRPFMRAMAMLGDALLEWADPAGVDEAIEIYEEMLDLNPNDNQGVRDPLVACYLRTRRYDRAADLLKRYESDWMAVSLWARVLLAYITEPESQAIKLLKRAREQNPHVELYLIGRKRRPRAPSDYYSPGEESEASFCAEVLWEAWKKHPRAGQWLQQQCGAAIASSSGRGAVKRESVQAHYDKIISVTDAFCESHLNDEYKEICRKLARMLCEATLAVTKGKVEGWAAGVVLSAGRVNFLSDPTETPHLPQQQITKALGVSQATMHAKSRVIDEALDLRPFDPRFTLPSKMHDNPMVWMIQLDGVLVDIRMMPREAQQAAFDRGLIPYLPSDRSQSS